MLVYGELYFQINLVVYNFFLTLRSINGKASQISVHGNRYF